MTGQRGPGPKPGGSKGRRTSDPARQVAFDALRAVHADDAYANLVLSDLLAERRLGTRDAAFATELLSGTCRLEGTYDQVIAAAAGRSLGTLQPAVVDLLRLGAHQLLSMRVPQHAAVAATVDLAAATVGRRVTGLVNAVLRKVAARDLSEWTDHLSAGLDERDALALRTHHPRWVVDALADVLPASELSAALAADNVPPRTTLAVRPGLARVSELVAAGGTPGRWSQYAVEWPGNPADSEAVRDGRAGVQDEGSQLVASLLAAVSPERAVRETTETPWWLDLCAGPGGKAALLAGLAAESGARLLASDRQPHRAVLVSRALRAYRGRPYPPELITADGTQPAWPQGRFDRVLADVPCTGLGALRRRPEARWRRRPSDVDDLGPLQRSLLAQSLAAVRPGGVVAYVTCSPHAAETTAVVNDVLAEHPDVESIPVADLLGAVGRSELRDATIGDFLQLWPHRHGTDAMFCALLRRRTESD
ncbi:MAG: RsmB/NOP family class I SAM-dependent RNA methyltransferase [Propionibacteriaceae bacterium]